MDNRSSTGKAKIGKYDMLFMDSQDSKPLIKGDEKEYQTTN